MAGGLVRCGGGGGGRYDPPAVWRGGGDNFYNLVIDSGEVAWYDEIIMKLFLNKEL